MIVNYRRFEKDKKNLFRELKKLLLRIHLVSQRMMKMIVTFSLVLESLLFGFLRNLEFELRNEACLVMRQWIVRGFYNKCS